MRSEFIKNKIGFVPPKDWKVYKLGELTEINSNTLGTKTSPDQRINYIDLGSVNTGTIDLPAEEFIFKDAPSRARRVISAGDILMSTVRPNLKGFARADDKTDGYVCSTGFAVLSTKSKVDSKLIYQSLFTESFERQFYQLLVGSSYPAINNSDVEKLFLAMPNGIEERKSIVEILSTWDEAIAKTEKLIQAKKRYKKGLMQRLLSGKVRFPEFEGEDWVEVKLGEVFDRVTEKNEDESVKNVLTISAQDGLVSQTDYYNKSVASKDLSNYIIIRQGDFAYNKSYSEGYPLGAIKRLDDYEKGVLSPLYICFRLTSDYVDSDFITHFFEYGGLDHGIYKIAREGARNHGLLNVSVKDFFEIDLTLPQYDEQKKIATVLNESKKEVELLEAQLEKYQKQKKGLMQQLLTGKVRVKHMETDSN